MDTVQAVNNDYAQYDEDGRLRSRHGLVEYLTTMRYHFLICERADMVGMTHQMLDILRKR